MVAMFTLLANLAKKLNIPPEEFNDMLDDVKSAEVYLHEMAINSIKRKEQKNV